MMNKEKWLYTMEVFDGYEKRFANARVIKEQRFPWKNETRNTIIEETKKLLDETYVQLKQLSQSKTAEALRSRN